ncbi:glycine--tRNA ligase subunit beta, partial [bacterium]|nr:glycine--tRNA ligase subunit beta [bacterium]
VIAEASAFARDRLAGHLTEEGTDADVVAAVVASSGAHPLDARARSAALSALRSARGEDFEALAAGCKRAKNILKKGAVDGDPVADKLVEPAEKDLHAAYVSVSARVRGAVEQRRYDEAFTALAELRAPIDAFFDSVLVMADDEAVRANRLRLLGRIVEAMTGIADLSRLAALEEKA